MGEPLSHMPLIDMYISEDGKKKRLWVLTNSADKDFKPRLEKSVVHFRNGTCEKWKKGNEKLIKHDNIFYDYKNKSLLIEPSWLHEPYFIKRVDRFFGKVPKKSTKLMDYVNHIVKIDYDNRFYDFERDTINLIIGENV